MPMDQSKPNGVPRERMWILQSAWDDLRDYDHAVQIRLRAELGKRYFSLDHIATKVMPSLYRIRLGDQYRATVHKEHDQFFIMRIIPKKDDQRYYVASSPPSHAELQQADRLPHAPQETEDIPSITENEAAAEVVNGVVPANAVFDHTVESHNDAGRVNGEAMPGPIREVMQKLQSVFMYFADEQVELFKTISDVSDDAQQRDKAHRDDGTALRDQVSSQSVAMQKLVERLDQFTVRIQSLTETNQQSQRAVEQHDVRFTQITEHFDAALEIAANQIQALQGQHAELLQEWETERAQHREMTATVMAQQGQLESLTKSTATLQDWKGAYPELHGQLMEMHTQRSTEQVVFQTALSGLREQLQRSEVTQAAQATQFDSRLEEADAARVQLQQQITALQSRLDRAEKRGFWSWLTGR